MAARWRAAQNARTNFEVQYVLSAMSSQESEQFFAASRISLIWRSPAVRAPRFIAATKFGAASARRFPGCLVSCATPYPKGTLEDRPTKTSNAETVDEALVDLAVKRGSTIHRGGV
jgi:hypothetical protein